MKKAVPKAFPIEGSVSVFAAYECSFLRELEWLSF